jgi:hypothetical protein
MSTKTVKLNANLHEELKKIAEKEGFVLQDLIEEKLNEVLEEKGIYHFEPTDVQFSPTSQLFTLSLTPAQYQTLLVLLKRLCLNEKINNITQMNMILDSVKKLELVYKTHENSISGSFESNDDLLNSEGFYKSLLNAISNQLNRSDIDLKIVESNFTIAKEPSKEFTINADEIFKSLESHHLTGPMFASRLESESDYLLKLFDKKNYIGKMADEFWKILIETDIKNGKSFSIKFNSNDLEVSKLQDITATLKPYTMLDKNLFFLYVIDDEMFFTGDFFTLLKKYNIDIDINVVKKHTNDQYL